MKVDTDLIRLPFKAGMFVFDDQISRNIMYGVGGKVAPKSGIITTYLYEANRNNERVIVLFSIHSVTPSSFGEAFCRTVRLDPGKQMEDALNSRWEEDKNDPRFIFGEDWAHRAEDELTSEAGLRFIRLLVNAALYTVSLRLDMTEVDAPLPPPDDGLSRKERQRQLQSYNARSHLNYIDLGPRLGSIEDRRSVGERGKLERRVRVKGHHRPQAYMVLAVPSGSRYLLSHTTEVLTWRTPSAGDRTSFGNNL
jgi:hypothetical protein